MSRERTQKDIGWRHKRESLGQQTGFQYWLFRGSLLLAIVVLACFGAIVIRGDDSLYSKGPLSPAHAFIGKRCEACHSEDGKRKPGLLQKAGDNACLTCHEAPKHQEKQFTADVPSCGSCHAEHLSLVQQVQTPDSQCVRCHGQMQLKTNQDARVTIERKSDPDHPWHRWPFRPEITHFDDKRHHPKFSAEPGEFNNPTTIAFSHSVHLNLEDSNGKPTNLQCSNCHRPVAEDSTPWTFVVPKVEKIDFQPKPKPAPKAYPDQTLHPDHGRMIMTMPKYEQSCGTGPCHNLTFADKGLPVDHPKSKDDLSKVSEQVRSFIEGYRKSNNGKLPSVFSDWSPQCACDRTAHPITRVLEKPEDPAPKTDQQRMESRIKEAERFLWNARCRLCHQPDSASAGPGQAGTLKLEDPDWNPKNWIDSQIVQRFMPYAVFSHQVHSPVACEECHAPPPKPHCCEAGNPDAVAQSHDIHMPGIATCVQCHNASPARDGHAENGCFLCHQYHPWNPSRQIFRSRHSIEEFTGRKPPEAAGN